MFALPLLWQQTPAFGDALGAYYIYYFNALFAPLGCSLFPLYLARWRGKITLGIGFGMAFVGAAALLFTLPLVGPLLVRWNALDGFPFWLPYVATGWAMAAYFWGKSRSL